MKHDITALEIHELETERDELNREIAMLKARIETIFGSYQQLREAYVDLLQRSTTQGVSNV